MLDKMLTSGCNFNLASAMCRFEKWIKNTSFDPDVLDGVKYVLNTSSDIIYVTIHDPTNKQGFMTFSWEVSIQIWLMLFLMK